MWLNQDLPLMLFSPQTKLQKYCSIIRTFLSIIHQKFFSILKYQNRQLFQFKNTGGFVT